MYLSRGPVNNALQGIWCRINYYNVWKCLQKGYLKFSICYGYELVHQIETNRLYRLLQRVGLIFLPYEVINTLIFSGVTLSGSFVSEKFKFFPLFEKIGWNKDSKKKWKFFLQILEMFLINFDVFSLWTNSHLQFETLIEDFVQYSMIYWVFYFTRNVLKNEKFSIFSYCILRFVAIIHFNQIFI